MAICAGDSHEDRPKKSIIQPDPTSQELYVCNAMSNPKQLKAVLTSLREAIASVEKEEDLQYSASSATKAFTLVLTSELSSRGITVDLPTNDADNNNNSEWIISLLEAIQTNAGKVAIDDVDSSDNSGYPVPMMAALNAAQGMAVSACASICSSSKIYNNGDECVDNFTLLPIKTDDGVAKAYKEAIKRCQDVDDGRFYTLLKLVTFIDSPEQSSSSSGGDSSSSIPKNKLRQVKLEQINQLQHTLNSMAYANYLHGAVNYAPDQPPMWKRCLDSALLLSKTNDDNDEDQTSSTNGSELNYKAYLNSQTIQPLNNMIRIAELKGNDKRAKELSLLLALGYLGGVMERLDEMKRTKKEADGSNSKEGEPKLNTFSVKELVQKYYVERTPMPIELEIMTVPSLLEAAKKALSACGPIEEGDDPSQGESWLLFHYIQEQMEYLAEESNIWSEVHRQYRAMLNRKPDADIPSIGAKKPKGTTAANKAAMASSKEEMETQIRVKVYAEAYNEWKNNSLKLESLSSLALRDAIVPLSSALPPQTMVNILQDCQLSLIHQIERLEAMAIIVQKKSKTPAKEVLIMWQALLSFISPLMTGGDHHASNNSSATQRCLLEACSEAAIVASWMCEPLVKSDGGGSDIMNDVSNLLSRAQLFLTACQTGRAEEKRLLDETNQEPSVLSSKEQQSDLEKKSLLRLECAFETSRCRTELGNAIDEDEVDISSLLSVARKATIAATGGLKNISDLTSPVLSATSSKALFGMPYLHFLSVWSGMHLSPWPYCNVGQARTVLKQARDALRIAEKNWGRRLSKLEQVLLDIGEADLENVLLGGNADESRQLYSQALTNLDVIDGDDIIRGKLKAVCLIGLARLCLSAGTSETAEAHARGALDLLLSLGPTHSRDAPNLLCLHSWSILSLNNLSHSHQLCSSRQLVAEACIQSSRFDDARSFLTDAVKEMPGNFDATFSLASFHLRMQCLGNETDENETKNYLLRAAKMDTSKASPFALLGIWYESKNDTKRAEGCYQKALTLDFSHPVAGRGLLRLLDLKGLVQHCKKAIEQNSPVNGWAWQALGQYKSANEGDDSTAVICFQRALRCRDVQNPGSDLLGAFYNFATMAAGVSSEASSTWVELASCYRRMGKYSAALRAYEEAALTGTLPATALCSWAQVDLDLGLHTEAAEKCDSVLASADCSAELSRMAAYIAGEALLSISRRDIQGGKNGSCRSHLSKAIALLEDLLQTSNSTSYCEVKLLGDLYSLGEALPPYVFHGSSGGDQQADTSLTAEVENKLSFIKKGEQAYTQATEIVAKLGDEEEDKPFLLAATYTDLGTNLLSQAKVIAMALGDGSGGDSKTAIPDLASESVRVKDLILRSINAFALAVDHIPNDAAAWCGLGSALVFVDPLLSQHAFCRALQIDKSIVESLSNIGLLYADYVKTDKSAEILDALTQLEDTPLMWIGRGLLLEKTSSAWQDSPTSREGCLTRASDAYRASLQIMQHPAALLGLSLTCRRADTEVQTSDQVYSSLADTSSKLESRISMSLHQSSTGGGNIGASMIDGLFRIEKGLEDPKASEASRMVKEGIVQTRSCLSAKISHNIDTTVTNCEINIPSPACLQKKGNGEFPNDSIEKSLNQAMADIDRNTSEEKSDESDDDSLDKARNAVVCNPDSGELWLCFAKELTQAADATEPLLSAKEAADKALILLQDQILNACLITPRRKAVHNEKMVEYSEKSVVSAIPSSSLVSDAMSLASWLHTMEEDDQSRADAALLQESLMLDPLNEVAAAALGL